MALNMIFVNDTGLPDDQVFITFQDPAQTLDASHGNGIKITRGGTKKDPDVMTQSLSLTTIGAGGLSIANAAGPVVFVSYAATKAGQGFDMGADLSGADQPSYIGSGGANYEKCFQPFEITAVAGATNGQGNLTNINYFAAPIAIQSYNGGKSGTLLQTRGYYGGTATGTATLAAALNKLIGGANASLGTVKNSGKTLRYIGPSSFGAGTNPYSDFTAYLTALHTAGVKSATNPTPLVTKIQNANAFNTMAVPVKGNINYNFALDFTATFAADGTITVAGDIHTTITKFGEASTTGTTYTGASFTISPTNGPGTSAAIFTNTIYGQADPKGVGAGSTTFNSVWDTLAADMAGLGLYLSTAYATTQSLAIGEITTGLLGGFVGSDLAYSGGQADYANYDGQKYKDVPSAAWWNTQTTPSPAKLQPDHAFYSSYSDVIFDATDNQVYSIPFSDRFGKGPLMQTQLDGAQTVDTWVVTLGKPIFMT